MITVYYSQKGVKGLLSKEVEPPLYELTQEHKIEIAERNRLIENFEKDKTSPLEFLNK